MRFALIGAAALAATAAAFFAIAQPTPSTQTPARQLMPIDWEELRDAVKNQRLQRTRTMKVTIAANAPRPSLPMLLPLEPTMLAAAINVFPRPDSYAASMRMGDITIEVHGDRRAAVLAKDDPLMQLAQGKSKSMVAGREVPVVIDKTEGGFDITFSRFGAAYLIAIECRQPETDERCTKPEFVEKLAQRMALAGPDSP
ncbi:MAG: hypothetical protein HOP13_02610 [Alphaproteobacteria bacterium]|nr:hypothetical protein [Alphaproteobacteria bacterium]